MKYMELDYKELETDAYYDGLEEMHKILSNLSESECKKFIMKNLCKDTDFRIKFRSHFPHHFHEATRQDYEKRIENRIYGLIRKLGKKF